MASDQTTAIFGSSSILALLYCLKKRFSWTRFFFSALPLEIDFDESSFVYSSLIKMIATFPKEFPGMIESHIPRMVDIMSQAIECKKIKEPLRNFMAKTCSNLMNSKDHGEKLKEMIGTWPLAKRQPFLARLAS